MNTVPRIWPVIHLSTVERAVENARMAEEAGVHGVFLIHMDGEDHLIAPAAARITKACPSLLLGANFLSRGPLAALEQSLALGLDATWADRPGVRSDAVDEEAVVISERLQVVPEHRFFAAVAFKYQRVDPQPAAAAAAALALGMVPTTSGVATGKAPDLVKLRTIREHIGQEAPLALASGVTPENAGVFAPLLSDILVSTGISIDFHRFEAGLLDRLVDAVRVHG